MTTITVSDSATLNAALKTAQAGDTILLRTGTYSGISIKQHDVAGNVTVTSADAARPAVITDLTIRQSSGYTFQGLDILVNDKSPAVGAVGVFDSRNITFDHLTVHGSLSANPRGVGVNIADSTNVQVVDSEFKELYIGVRHLDSEQLVVSRNYIHDIRMDGIRGGGSSNVTIQNNYIRDFHRVDGDHSDAIQFYYGVKNLVVHDINVSNNVMEQGNGTDFQGIFLRTTDAGLFQNVTIANNIQLGGSYNGIYVEHASGVTITNNSVISRPGETTWIAVKSTQGAVLTNNVAVKYVIDAESTVTQSSNRFNVAASDLGASALREWVGLNVSLHPSLPSELSSQFSGRSGTLLEAHGTHADHVTASGSTTLNATAHDLTLTGAANADGAGNALNNHIVGNSGSNKLYGFGGDDTIEGGDGDDTLDGGDGVDTLSYEHAAAGVTVSLVTANPTKGVTINTGGAGTDKLIGFENISGSRFDDTLTGDGGVNVLSGGAGDDKLVGKAGADVLFGGAGADTFYYMDLSDSTVASRDKIMDFSHADGDVIDLRKVDAITGNKGDDKFTLVSNFTNKAGQLVVASAGDHYVVQGDVNGDGVADFAIDVYSKTSLTSSDFLF